METRKIIIVDSSTNKKVVVNTDAVNFGELKRAARAAGINDEGKDWLEGITKTSPMSDDSLLPTNVSYKGTITNNLVYMLTNTNKKIRSGMNRHELYANVKKFNLEEEIKRVFGRNFTQVDNVSLESIVSKKLRKVSKATVKDVVQADYKQKYDTLVYAIAKFIAFIPNEIGDAIAEKVEEIAPETIVQEVNFSDSELASLFK